jgi:hypothetical protein
MALTQELLPGGYWDARGTLHRQFEIIPLSGREEALLAGNNASPAALVTAVLSRCVQRIGYLSPVTEEISRGLLVADRQCLLLRLREMTFGDTIAGTIVCPWPDCGANVDIDFSTKSVPIIESADKGPWYEMELSPKAEFKDDEGYRQRRIAFRLPNGDDQETIAPVVRKNESQALQILLGRCIRGTGTNPLPGIPLCERLNPLACMEIEQQMQKTAPKVELTMSVSCPECGRAFSAPFDLQEYFFGELRISRDLLYREVHYLAFHYHWSESEIMAMPRDKRRAYMKVLAEELENLNNAF